MTGTTTSEATTRCATLAGDASTEKAGDLERREAATQAAAVDIAARDGARPTNGETSGTGDGSPMCEAILSLVGVWLRTNPSEARRDAMLEAVVDVIGAGQKNTVMRRLP